MRVVLAWFLAASSVVVMISGSTIQHIPFLRQLAAILPFLPGYSAPGAMAGCPWVFQLWTGFCRSAVAENLQLRRMSVSSAELWLMVWNPVVSRSLAATMKFHCQCWGGCFFAETCVDVFFEPLC